MRPFSASMLHIIRSYFKRGCIVPKTTYSFKRDLNINVMLLTLQINMGTPAGGGTVYRHVVWLNTCEEHSLNIIIFIYRVL